MLDAKFLTLTIYDGDQILEPHDSLAEADMFASEVATEGYDCAVLQILSTVPGEYVPYIPLEKLYGMETGVGF